MQRIIILLLFVCILPIYAGEKENIKAEHERLLQNYGQFELLKGQHNFIYHMTQIVEGSKRTSKVNTISTFTLGNTFCVYKKLQNEKMYLQGKIIRGKTTKISVVNKRIKNGITNTLKYHIYLEKNAGVQAKLDKASTDTKVDWNVVLQCILKHAPELYSLIKDCFNTTNSGVVQCILKLIDPLSQVYTCIFPVKTVKKRMVMSREIRWDLRLSTTGNFPLYTFVTHKVTGRIFKRWVKVTAYSPNIIKGKANIKEISEKTTEVFLTDVQWTGPFAYVKGFVHIDYEK